MECEKIRVKCESRNSNVLLNSFRLDDYTSGIHPQSQNLQPPCIVQHNNTILHFLLYNPYNGLYGKIPPERCTFFRLEV